MGFGQISVKVGDEELEVNQFLYIIQRVKENCSRGISTPNDSTPEEKMKILRSFKGKRKIE